MESLPQLESCLRLAFDAPDAEHASGVSLASWFVRAPTRGRRRSDLDAGLLFPTELRARLGEGADRAIALAMDPASWRTCAVPRPTVPLATREWLAEAALALTTLLSVADREGVPRPLLLAVSRVEGCEDADCACGRAAALHLARHGWSEFGAQIEIRQGAEVGRPSVIHARVEGSADHVTRITVGGSAVIVARGEYRLQ